MTLDAKTRSRLSAAGTANLSDAMERLGFPRTVITGFRCSTEGAVAGAAFTIRQVPKHAPAIHDQRLVRHDEVSALRALSDRGIGLVLDAGRRAGYTLAANVRLSLVDYIGTEVPENVIDRERLQAAFARHRNLAAGGEAVELTMTGENSGTLSVPGRGTIEITGRNRLVVIRRLVDAHRSGAGAQKTEDMVKGFGEQSLSNIFGSVLWKKLRSGFLRSTGKGKWKIAV